MKVDSINIKEALVYANQNLLNREYGNVSLEARMMLKKLLDVDDIYIMMHGERMVEAEILEKYFQWIELRNQGYPIQYILKEQEFMGIMFQINDKVLVPRSDTEILVEACLELLKNIDKEKIEVLDIGTGSGAIPVSIAYYNKKVYASSVDINLEAIDIAMENAKAHGVADRVSVFESNLFENISGKYDLIVSNPPYIESSEIETLQEEVKTYEPRLALDGGLDGLDFYRNIIKEAPLFLNSHGFLAFEIGHNQGILVSSLMTDKFKDIKVIKDYGNHDRVVVGQLID